MKALLERYKNEGKFLSVYTENDKENFFYGKILAVNDDEFSARLVNPDGVYDGILVKPTYSVTRIEADGQYDKKMSRLIQSEAIPAFAEIDEEDITASVLETAKAERKIVALELLNSGINDVVGFVEEISNGICKINQRDEYGAADGFSYVQLNSITQLEYDTIPNQRILKLCR